MPAPTRRALLRVGALALPVSLAGCSGAADPAPERHRLTVYNEPDDSHVFHVAVSGAQGNLLEASVHLDPNHASDTLGFAGEPSSVTVHVDGRHRATIDWAPQETTQFNELHPDGCPEGDSTSLEVYLGTEGEFAETDVSEAGDGIFYTFDCASVSPTDSGTPTPGAMEK